MPYQLKFSDPSKIAEVFVPDMPPGINTLDTSLNLVGRGYPNYGEKMAENFLHLLENFASALPPENPIEGQLWYDTSNPANKVLRIMDGTATSTRWPAANGIYQQATDPKDSISASLKNGDIWVDTSLNQLKIYNSNAWTVVGPVVGTGASKTGSEPATIIDTSGILHNVIKSYVDDDVVSIFANEYFVPRIVLEGFTAIYSGITVSTKNSGSFNGIASSSMNLEVMGSRYSSSEFLRKSDQSFGGQEITGKVIFQTPNNQSAAQGRDGVLINIAGYNAADYIQLYKYANDAILLNNRVGGKIICKVNSTEVLKIESSLINLNTGTVVNGSMSISSTLTVFSTQSNAVTVLGGINAVKDVNVGGNMLVSGVTTTTGLLSVGSASGVGTIIEPNRADMYDIGSITKPFRNLHVSYIGSTSTIIYGTLIGYASKLSFSSQFKLQGQVTATSFTFVGDGSTATFDTILSSNAILDQPEITTSTAGLTILVLDTSTTVTSNSLRRISRDNFLEQVFPVGMITAYGGAAAPNGWLLCDGYPYAVLDYLSLYSVIGTTYGGGSGSFNVPDLTTSTTAAGYAVNYIIKS